MYNETDSCDDFVVHLFIAPVVASTPTYRCVF